MTTPRVIIKDNFNFNESTTGADGNTNSLGHEAASHYIKYTQTICLYNCLHVHAGNIMMQKSGK